MRKKRLKCVFFSDLAILSFVTTSACPSRKLDPSQQDGKEAAKVAVFILRSLALLASLAVFPDLAVLLSRMGA